MRIWIITSEYPGELATGGIARYVENIAKAFVGKGIDLTIITLAKTDYHRQVAEGFSIIGFTSHYEKFSSEEKTPPLESKVFPYNLITYWPALSYQVADLVESLIQRFGAPDVIECQEYGALPYYLLQRKLIGNSLLQNVPILVHCHSPVSLLTKFNHRPTATFPDYWIGEMEKFSIAAADALLCPTHYMAKQIADIAPHREKIDVIPLPNPLADFFTTSSVVPSPHAKPTVLYFGRLEVRKGILPAMEDIESLWNSGRDFRVVLLGGDEEYMPRGTTVGTFIRSRYAHRIKTNVLEMHDSCAMGEVGKYIIAAQIVIIPSLWESFCNTCMEAMFLGRVVLASKSGAQAELIGADGQAGILFDWEVPGDFATQLDRLLKLSSTEKERIGNKARQRITELCSIEKITAQRLQHFEEIIRRHKKSSLFPAAWRGYTPPAVIHNKRSCLLDQQAPRLSVIIPFFNLGKYVMGTVQSILGSTDLPEEILIINDGSTDEDSLAVLQELEDLHPSIRVIHQPNRGLSSTRNRGAKEAQGEFIAFVDADDEVQPKFFEKALRVLEAYANVGFVYSWVEYFDDYQGIWPTWNIHLPYLLGHNMLVPICVVRKDAFLEIGGNNPKFEYNFEDYECWIHLTKRGWLGVSLPECLVRYRVRPGSMYRSATDAQFRYLYELLVRTHPELYQQWGSELAILQANNGSAIRWDHPAKKDFLPTEEYVRLVEKQRDEFWKQIEVLGADWNRHTAEINSHIAEIELLKNSHTAEIELLENSHTAEIKLLEERRLYTRILLFIKNLRNTSLVRRMLKGVSHVIRRGAS